MQKITYLGRGKNAIFKKAAVFFILLAFSVSQITSFYCFEAHAQSVLNLPTPGSMLTTSTAIVPPILKGIKIFPDDPLRFDFIIDTGSDTLSNQNLKTESSKLIKYFLASLTIPEEDLWVNLSPYEKDRIVPSNFGVTEMGRDLLAQDYILKQITASFIYPEEELGEQFWNKVYEKAHQLYGRTDIPINTFNKVWVVPDKAVIYENGDIRAMQEDYSRIGEDLWSRFRKPKKDQEWYYKSLAQTLLNSTKNLPDNSLFKEFTSIVGELFK